MGTWPASLPQGMGDRSSLSPVDSTQRTEMEAGPDRVRRVTLERMDEVRIVWRFSAAQMDAFRDFWAASGGADYGAAWFTMPLAVGGGMPDRDVRFLEPPVARSLTGRAGNSTAWEVTGRLEVATDA